MMEQLILATQGRVSVKMLERTTYMDLASSSKGEVSRCVMRCPLGIARIKIMPYVLRVILAMNERCVSGYDL
jgi:hypothetical protein